MATVAWTATGDTSFSFTARRWSPWLPTSARTFLPVLSVISVSPAKAALSRPWIEGKLSKNDCAYASAASPITRSTASAAPSPRSRAVRRIFCPIGDHAAWIRARGLCPPFVLIRSGTFRAMFGGAQDSTLSHSHQRRPNGEGYAARPRLIRARRPAFAKSSRPRFRGPLAAQGGEIRLQRPHLFANRGHALLEFGGVQLGQIVGHCRNPRSRVRLGGCGKQQKAPRRKRSSARRPRKRAERTPPLRWRCRQARARKPGRRRAPLRSTPPPPDGRRVARSRRCRPGARGRPSETEGIARAGAQPPRRGWD